MGISKQLKQLATNLSKVDTDRLIQMGWEDRCSFEAIEHQFGISPNQFVKFMRLHLSSSAFKRWRKRVYQQGRLKNQQTRGFAIARFKCTRQGLDGITKDWK